VVQFQNALADGQTQTGAGTEVRARCDLDEPFEDVAKAMGRNALAFIPYLDDPFSVGAF
jgi:hypothetical protein